MERLAGQGRQIQGELHSADASAGAEVPLYDTEENAVFSLDADEYLAVESVSVVSAAGGDVHVYFDNDGDDSPDAFETLARGTLGANGQMDRSFHPDFKRGRPGGAVRAVAPAGTLDVEVNAYARKVLSQTDRAAGTPIPDPM